MNNIDSELFVIFLIKHLLKWFYVLSFKPSQLAKTTTISFESNLKYGQKNEVL